MICRGGGKNFDLPPTTSSRKVFSRCGVCFPNLVSAEPTFGMSSEVKMSASAVRAFTSWDGVPAVLLEDATAFAVFEEGGPWTPVPFAEISNSGSVLKPETFAKAFPYADISTIPTKASPDSTTAGT
jgi:hypothetical protein